MKAISQVQQWTLSSTSFSFWLLLSFTGQAIQKHIPLFRNCLTRQKISCTICCLLLFVLVLSDLLDHRVCLVLHHISPVQKVKSSVLNIFQSSLSQNLIRAETKLLSQDYPVGFLELVSPLLLHQPNQKITLGLKLNQISLFHKVIKYTVHNG